MKKTILWSMLAFLSFIIYGCGSGDFSTGTTISGFASKGPITGGKVAIFAVTSSGHIGSQITTAIPQSGSFSANIGSYKGAIFATMSGGTYVSEAATGANASSPVPLQQRLRAATYISQTGPVNLAITPLTEVAFRQMSSSKGLTQTVIQNANANVTALYLKGLATGKTIVNTLPANILNTASTTSTNPDQINYGLALATISQMMTTATLESVIQTLVAQNTSAYTTAFTALPAANLLANVKATPLNVTLTTTNPSVTGGIAGSGSVSLTATVTGFAGAPIADNTLVTFSVVSGSGTFSAASAVTTGGTATVAISSTVVGTAGITATAGTVVSSPLSVPFAENPEDPGSVTLSSSASSAVVGQTMTLTAKVGVVGGGTVTAGSPPSSPATVTFTIVHGSGTLTSGSNTSTGSITAVTDTTSGNAVVTLTSATAGNITLSATAGTSPVINSNTLPVAFTPNPSAPATVTVSASSTSSPADGSTPVTFTIKVTNYAGTALPSVPLTIGASAGTLSAATAITDANGNATVTLTSSAVGSATVTVSATAAAVTATGTAQVNFTTPPARPTTAIVKVRTAGTFTSGSSIGGIQATLTYPTTKGLTPTSEIVSGSAVSGTFSEFNPNTPGDVIMGVISSTGFALGEFATITFSIGSGTPLPVTTDFVIASGSTVTNAAVPSVTQPNISVSVLSVTFQ
jgi:adhesin/invasin